MSEGSRIIKIWVKQSALNSKKSDSNTYRKMVSKRKIFLTVSLQIGCEIMYTVQEKKFFSSLRFSPISATDADLIILAKQCFTKGKF